jgi:hypothetical protein
MALFLVVKSRIYGRLLPGYDGQAEGAALNKSLCGATNCFSVRKSETNGGS